MVEPSLKQSTSSVRGLRAASKLAELFEIGRMHWIRRDNSGHLRAILSDIDEYAEMVRTHSNHARTSLQNLDIFEIGYGARPYRLLTLQSLGARAAGIDVDVPALRGRPAEFWAMLRRNSFERAFKSLIRYFIFDRRERWNFNRLLTDRGYHPTLDVDAFRVGFADEAIMPECSLDLIYSEDVFEHIPVDRLERLIQRMSSWLRPGGIALIRPNVYTGITGGHLAEWYLPEIDMKRRSEPWDHLRKRQFPPNTYLNGLWRADYRRLFLEHFAIVAEFVRVPNLGGRFLTDDLRLELAAYPDEELFSNQVLFVLTPKVRKGRL